MGAPESPHSLLSSTLPAGGYGLTWEAVTEIGVQQKQEEKVLPDKWKTGSGSTDSKASS